MTRLARYTPIVGSLEQIPGDTFKGLFMEYLAANEMAVSWEGFKQRDLYGFGVVLWDFLLFASAEGHCDAPKVPAPAPLRVPEAEEVPEGLRMGLYYYYVDPENFDCLEWDKELSDWEATPVEPGSMAEVRRQAHMGILKWLISERDRV